MCRTALGLQTATKSKNGKGKWKRHGKERADATQAFPPKTVGILSMDTVKTAIPTTIATATKVRSYSSKLKCVKSTLPKAQISATKPKSASFLDLAPEIRNQIYEHAIDDRRVQIKRGHRANRKTGHMTELIYESLDPEIVKAADAFQVKAPMIFTVGLFRANRQISREVTTILYAKTTFVFHSVKPLRFFLNQLSTLAKESIRNLELRHLQYAYPLLTENCWAKEKSDFKFYVVCEKAANELKSLRDLKIELNIKDRPVQLNLEADWALPFMLFAGKGLVATQAKLVCSCYKPELVVAYAKVLERELLSTNAKKAWYVGEEKAVAETKRMMRQVIKAKKVPRVSSSTTSPPDDNQQWFYSGTVLFIWH